MSIAQIPAGTVVPEMVSSIDPHTVIPVGTILKEGTLIPEPLNEQIDTRDPKNKTGLHQAPLFSVIPDGVLLPKGTYIPVAVQPGTVFPNRAILPIGSKIPDQTSVPYGSIVAEGTELDESKFMGVLDKMYGFWKKISSARGILKSIPLGTHIPKDTMFPVQSKIITGTRIVLASTTSFDIAIPHGTVVHNAASLQPFVDEDPQLANWLPALRDARGARLPKNIVVTHPTNEQIALSVYLPPGTIIPKFSDGRYAVIPPGTVIPLLANGAAATIPENTIITRTDKEENNVAANTVVPEGAKIPPGTVIPDGAIIPEGVILFVPTLEDGRPTILPPRTHIPAGAIFPAGLVESELCIAYGTHLPKSTTTNVHITPEVEVPENFQLHPSGDVKEIIIQKGTYIPKTDMVLKIPKGTVIPNNVPWTFGQAGLETFQTLGEYLHDTNLLQNVFFILHLFLICYAVQHHVSLSNLGTRQHPANPANLLLAVLFPELYLFLYVFRQGPHPTVLFWVLFSLFAILGFMIIKS